VDAFVVRLVNGKASSCSRPLGELVLDGRFDHEREVPSRPKPRITGVVDGADAKRDIEIALATKISMMAGSEAWRCRRRADRSVGRCRLAMVVA
jgi:hypothetical protein